MFILFGVRSFVIMCLVVMFRLDVERSLGRLVTFLDIRIVKGVISSDHVHLLISYPPKVSVSDIVKRLKDRSARLLMEDFTELKKRFWGGHFWEIGYGAWSSGNITDEMIKAYLEHHKDNPNSDQNFILE